MVPLLPKLRGHFAEFLNHSYPERLSIFNLTTCVGLGYGPYTHIARGFSRQYRITNFTFKGYASRLDINKQRIYLPLCLHAYTNNPISGMATSLCHPIAWTTFQAPRTHTTPTPEGATMPCLWVVSINALPRARIYGYQNINWLSIDYACRPRLRSRLTLGRRT